MQDAAQTRGMTGQLLSAATIERNIERDRIRAPFLDGLAAEAAPILRRSVRC
jgi:hypothetical protein